MQGDDKKLETQIVFKNESGTPSGSVCPGLAEINSIQGAKGIIGIMNEGIILLAKTSPKTGNANAQAPKQESLGQIKPQIKLKEELGMQPPLLKQPTESGHGAIIVSQSTAKRVAASITHNGEILDNFQQQQLHQQLYRVVVSELNKYKNTNGKFNGNIRIIDSKMLHTC